MRLIDADALLNELGDIWNIPKDWDGDIDETCETAFDVIENAPTVEAKPVGWIPCSEKLPEEAGFYIVTKRQKSGEIQVALGSYRPLFNEWSGNGNFKDVLAWMPLPEPYREDDES